MSVSTLIIITCISALLYIASSLLLMHGRFVKKGYALCLIAGLFNLIIVLRNAFINGYVPFVSMYQVLTFLALLMTISGVYICFVKKHTLIRFLFPMLSGVILIGVAFMTNNGEWMFPPALDSPFFVPHVLLYMISYTLCGASFMCCLWGMLTKKHTTECENACTTLVKTALPFMLSGLLCGAVWANEVWGAFWTWDIKECFSLLTLLCYSGFLHTRNKSLSRVFMILGFVSLVFTLLFVNMLPSSSLHTYS